MSIIQNNLPAMRAWRMKNDAEKKLGKSSEKLAGALNINSAADDAAGLAISEKMKAQMRGMVRAEKNVGEAIDLIDTADGALSQYHGMIHRIRELCVQASSDTNETSVDRKAIQEEIAQITNEINELSKAVRYNDIHLFDGSIMGDYEYAYGLRQPVMERMPALITALDEFEKLKITGGENAQFSFGANETQTRDGGATSCYHWINNGGTVNNTIQNYIGEIGQVDSFPREGCFTIRVDDPTQGSTRAIINFNEMNADGSMTFDDFKNYITNELWHVADVSIGDDGALKIEGKGLGGAASHIIVGEQYGTTDGKYVNSSFFGANASRATQSFGVVSNIFSIPDADFHADYVDGDKFVNDEALWRSIIATHGPVSFQFDADGSPNDPFNPPYVLTIDKDNVDTFNTIQKVVDEANRAYNAGSYKPVFSSFTIDPSVHRDRDGRVWVEFAQSPANPPYYSSYDPNYWDDTGYNAINYHDAEDALLARSYVTTHYLAEVSEDIGLFTVAIGGIPNEPSPLPKSAIVTLDFTESFWGGKTPQDIVEYINNALNDEDNWPVPMPEVTESDYDADYPVAKAELLSDGRLRVTVAEHEFNVSIEEKYSDRPMLLQGHLEVEGVDWGNALEVADDFGQIERIPIKAGIYKTLDEFITKNQPSAELAGYALEKSEDGKYLVVSSLGRGSQYTVADIGMNPPAIRFVTTRDHAEAEAYEKEITRLLGIETFTSQDGYSRATGAEKGLWIQSGANKGDGLYISIPCLDAFDLGLMIYATDRLDPDAYVGISRLGVDAYTTALNLDPHNPNPPLTQEELQRAAAKRGETWNIDADAENEKLKKRGHSLDVSTHEKASEAIHIANNALNIVSTERAMLGAKRNRLEFKAQNLNVSAENQQEAQSRIADADIAKETTRRLRYSILMEASTAMLGQANASPQNTLQLLR